MLQESSWLITRWLVGIITSTQILEGPCHCGLLGSEDNMEEEKNVDLYFKEQAVLRAELCPLPQIHMLKC